MPGENQLPVHRSCLLSVSSHDGPGKELSGVSFIRVLDPSPHWGMRILTLNWGGVINIQSVERSYLYSCTFSGEGSVILEYEETSIKFGEAAGSTLKVQVFLISFFFFF